MRRPRHSCAKRGTPHEEKSYWKSPKRMPLLAALAAGAAVELSPIVAARAQGNSAFSVQSVDLHALGDWASPVAALDHFRVRGRPFPPHPHAGFSAVTYVLEDSKAALRSRDSLGDDVVVGPGGIVWTEAGRGVMHEELPASDDELHGLQIF